MREIIISATIEALKSIQQARFFQTERGYHGKFYCELHKALDARGILNGNVLLEMEYQKSERHGTYQRPDIILHIPAELHGTPVQENNFAVFALKRRVSQNEAEDDFRKLDIMFGLHYTLGFFINVDSTRHHLNNYTGTYRDCLHAFAVKMVDDAVSIIHAWWIDDEIREEHI
ncbi:MAG: hypothetical protein WCE94_08590 [Candidatus Methanoperedens sp.]